MSRRRSGAEHLAVALREAGVDHVFGVPGSQLVRMWDCLRREPALRVVRGTSELTASFMANGYARATGRPPVLLTIGGPGLAYAIPGLAEARLDSAPLVHVVTAPVPARADGAPGLQAIPQAAMLEPLVKAVLRVDAAHDVSRIVRDALDLARGDEPGPVVVEITEAASESVEAALPSEPSVPIPAPDVDELLERLRVARRPLMLCGQGAAEASQAVTQLAEALRVPVMTSTSGRGVISEAHPWSVPFDAPGAPAEVLDELVERADLVLVLGCGLSHNGTRGYALRLPAPTLVRVDTSAAVLERGYPASLSLRADVSHVMGEALSRLVPDRCASAWTADEIEGWRVRAATRIQTSLDPVLGHTRAGALFASLRERVPATTVVTTDSGYHQYLARAHFPVLAPRTLIVPSDFQSMGFGIPAAIGGALATEQPAVAITGDGGMNMVGLELLSAVREGVGLTVIVLVDRALGLIRLSQIAATGRSDDMDVPSLDLAALASSLGVGYRLVDSDEALDGCVASGTVTVLEVPMGEPPGLGRTRMRGRARSLLSGTIGEASLARLRDARRGGR